MKAPQSPRLETRRRREFSAELQERARAWIPAWEVTDNEGDFGRALLEIAARFNSEVAERLDIAGEKMRRGFLDWLAVRREAARPARMPVVFKLIDAARDPVLASAPVRMQADANGTAVVFETEKDVRVIPGLLDTVVGADADEDAFYLPPPGLSDLKPLKSMPSQWQAKSFASAGAEKIQLDPELGLVEGMLIRTGGQEYRIVAVDKDLVQIDPPLAGDLPESSLVSKVTTFSPFGGEARNWQEHVLYLGDSELLNIEAPATIEVVGAFERHEEFTWEYWGKLGDNKQVGWQPLEFDEERQKLVTDAVVLSKPKGAVEEKKIGEKNGRWIRAYANNVTADPLTSDEFSLRVNTSGCKDDLPCLFDDDTPSPLAEAMANTTPLVLDNVFFPLGKEPRQFDAFYLGSQEAFSKPGAKVQLCFQMADPTFSAVTAVREGTMANQVLAGVARDRALHLMSFDATGRIGKFRDRDPLQPPGITPLALDPQPPWRLPVWPDEPDFFSLQGFSVATSARNSIWVWHEHSVFATASRWIDFGKLPADVPVSDAPVDGLVFLNGTPPVLLALREGQLFVRTWPTGTQWDPVNTHIGSTRIRLKSIVPVLVRDTSGNLVTSTTAGMLGVDENNELFEVALDGTCTSPLPTFDFDPAIRPVAVEVGGVRTIAAVTKPANQSDPPDLVANNSTTTEQLTLVAGSKVLVALDAIVVGASTVQILATARESGAGGRLLTWAPFETGPAASLFKSPIVTGGLLEGAPTKVNDLVVIPGSSADLFVISFDPSLRLLKSDDVDIGVVLPAAVASLAVNDLMVRIDAGEPVRRKITAPVRTKDGEEFYPIISDFPAGASGLFAYKRSDEMSGSFSDPDLTLDDDDNDTAEDDWLLIDDKFYQVDSIAISGGHRVATLVVPNSTGDTPSSGDYVRPIDTRGRVAPFMRLDTSAGGSGDWDADLLRRVPLLFPGLTPETQRAKAFSFSVSNKPIVVVLAEEFQGAVPNPVDFLVDASFGEWRRNASDTSANPELSWEYWNGKGWWALDITRDETQNLKATGALRFVVPVDMASSDWAGRTNFWIRGRLVGGDYGKETVTVKIKQISTTESEQTVNRSLEGISPPSVLKLLISYAICGDGVPPKFVLTQDSGTIRDQSDANRTSGAIVETFIPLALTLGKLSQTLAAAGAPQDCPPECSCSEQQTAATTATQSAASATGDAGVTARRATGRSLFIGLAATPSEAPVNILLLVDERNHTAFAPMKVEALIANSFQPIVVDDTTRALGESGLLSMSFPISPTPSELFGKTLTWLRLIPKASATDEWIPTLRGAYLNAAWASATETLTRELLGSSDGAPNLTVRLARPPVLRDTLELRINEPLGEEEREALRLNDPKKVVNLRDLPGDWVLWTQVVDPNDEPPDARVYALDEASGEIRFGDGTHGRIPPIGRDSIVAFSYSRTETGQSGDTVPGNTIGPRTALNLVSPVETVETVTSADQAAGGAPAEPDNRVLRFGFARVRHRNRAVTPHDLEDLALQSSPDIVQARAVVRRGYIKLVIVMRGDNPQPTAAQVRELRRLLLDAAPASLSAPGALRIEGPKVRRLQIEVALRVETLDHAGQLGEFVKSRLKRLFDTAVGGVDQDGWPLGLNPTEDDIAFALIDAPHLESISAVQRREIGDRKIGAWPETVKETEIVMLADDPVRIEFETAEVLV